MSLLQKILAAFAGVSILALALWLGTILFVILLIAAPLLMLYGNWRMRKLRKEFEKHARASGSGDPEVIETAYVVVDEPMPSKDRSVDSGQNSGQ